MGKLELITCKSIDISSAYLLCQRDFANDRSSICIVVDVDLQLEFGQSERKSSKIFISKSIHTDVCIVLLCSASNQTIQPEFGNHHNPYECVRHILPIDCGHRNNSYSHSICYHIYPYRPKYQFSSHHV